MIDIAKAVYLQQQLNESMRLLREHMFLSASTEVTRRFALNDPPTPEKGCDNDPGCTDPAAARPEG